jgi:hypothetical protein
MTGERIGRPGTARASLASWHRELGKHLGTAAYRLIPQLGGAGTDRGCVGDCCRSVLRAHRGTAGKGDFARSLPVMANQLGQRVRLVLGNHLLVGKPSRAARQRTGRTARPQTGGCEAASAVSQWPSSWTRSCGDLRFLPTRAAHSCPPNPRVTDVVRTQRGPEAGTWHWCRSGYWELAHSSAWQGRLSGRRSDRPCRARPRPRTRTATGSWPGAGPAPAPRGCG